MKRLYTIDQFSKLIDEQQRDGESALAIASIGDPEIGESGRTVSYTFSTPAVGRDLHTVAADAWQLQNFLRNPVFLWAHDDSQPPIGRIVDIGNENGALKGVVEYVDRDVYPFADTIYQLVRSKYLNAVSTSWLPLDWKVSRDKARPGGVDFTKVDLLEISQVPVPALPGALAEARSRGIDTGPIYEWAERLLDQGGKIAVPRNELEILRRDAKMPKRTAAADDLKTKHKRALTRAPKAVSFKRGLYDVAQLAYLLEGLGYLHACTEYEAEIEGDDSPVPEMLAEALEALAVAFKAAAEEESDELLAAHGASDGEDEEGSELEAETRGLSVEERAHIAAGATARVRAWRAGIAVARAGKALSSSNEAKLEEADGHHERALKHHKALDDHHQAVSKHMGEARSAHEEATSTLQEFGEHVRGAQENPDDPLPHLKRAMKSHAKATEQMGAVADAHANMADRNEDVGDSHRAAQRCVRSAQRCVRSVVDGAETSEPDSKGADADENDEKAQAEKARRLRRVRALERTSI